MSKQISFAETIALVQFEVSKARNEILRSNTEAVDATGEQIQMGIVSIEIQMPVIFDVCEEEVSGSYTGIPIKKPFTIKESDSSNTTNTVDKNSAKVSKSMGLVMGAKVVNETDVVNPDFNVNKIGSIKMTFNALKM